MSSATATASDRGSRAGTQACTVVVAALGPSVKEFVELRDLADIVVGMNDIDRHLAPDHLVCLHGPAEFEKDRPGREGARAIIEGTRAKDAWLLRDWPVIGKARKHAIRIATIDTDPKKKARILPSLDGEVLYTAHTTVVPAIHLAYRLGATRIGVVGCDLTTHVLSKQIDRIDMALGVLRLALNARGIELVNLSRASAVSALEKRPMEAWLDG